MQNTECWINLTVADAGPRYTHRICPNGIPTMGSALRNLGMGCGILDPGCWILDKPDTTLAFLNSHFMDHPLRDPLGEDTRIQKFHKG